jgi:NADH-quinone oxidoreductase subunit L
VALLLPVVALLLWISERNVIRTGIPWITLTDTLSFTIGLKLDSLSKAMIMVVTSIGSLVHVYSLAYMRDDEGKPRFFGALSLFMFSMIGIVLSDNLAMMFIFWELVGVSSYLLIGHWFAKPSASSAANKAFLANRLGDFGFMMGILTIWRLTGSVDLDTISSTLTTLHADPLTLSFGATCLFCGAVGKSAQVPLHVWLPDAMEGPTPVSALIHAATMVAAGVYMLARVFCVLEHSDAALNIIASVGALTALSAAAIATQQDDLKRILAYSTLSQLGLMVMSVGLKGWAPAIFHLFTHAFFKALLFLAAGSVIFSAHHEQNIWKLGGLRKHLPITYKTFMVGSLALMGFPGFSGFFSKDTILLTAYHESTLLFCAGVVTALLTAFYMTRLIIVVFYGSPRSHNVSHAIESPRGMTVPLMVLAVASMVTGYSGVVRSVFGINLAHDVFSPESLSHSAHLMVPLIACGSLLIGSSLAYVLYRGQPKDPVSLPLLRDSFYLDQLYSSIIAGTQGVLSSFSSWLDRYLIDGVLVRGASSGVWGVGYIIRFLQVGSIQGYCFLIGLGCVVCLLLLLK